MLYGVAEDLLQARLTLCAMPRSMFGDGVATAFTQRRRGVASGTARM
jgi:hypothetical protein